MLLYSDVTSTITKMVSGGRGSEIMYCRKEVGGILDVGSESLDKRLEMVVKEGRDSFSGRANIGNDGSVGITRFMDFGK